MRHLWRLLPCCLLMLSACAPLRSTLLETPASVSSGGSLLTTPADEYFWIWSPPAGAHSPPPQEVQIPPEGIWVTEGWLMVESQCYSPKHAAKAAGDEPILPDTEDEKAIYIHAGQRFLLSCSDDKVGAFDLTKLDAGGSGTSP